MLVNVAFSEEPFSEIADLDNILKKGVYFKALEYIDAKTVFK